MCADWALLDELVDTQLGWILLCWHADCTHPTPDLELEFTRHGRSSETRALQGDVWCWPGLVYSLPSHLSPSFVRHLFAYCECEGVISSSCLAVPPVFGLASYFSCSNTFVLPDTCENGRLWAIVSSAVPPHHHHTPSSSEHLCVVGFTVCSGVKTVLFFLNHSSLCSNCFLYLKNKEWKKWHTGQSHRELHHTEAFADMAPTGLMEYQLSGTVNAFGTFYSLLV